YFLFMFSPPAHFYTLSLHDALPISHLAPLSRRGFRRDPRHRLSWQAPDPGASDGAPVRFRICSQRLAVLGQEGLTEFIESRTGADRKSTRLNSSHVKISYAVFCLKK